MRYIITILFLFSALIHCAENYRVQDSPLGLELITPEGSKSIIGDYAPNGAYNYRIEIPLSSLKSPESAQNGTTHIIERVINNETGTTKEPQPIVINPQLTLEDKRKAEDNIPKTIIEWDETDRLVMEANRLYNKRKFKESLNLVDEIIRRNPKYTRGWVMRGSLMKMQGQPDLAKKAWIQALNLEPKNQDLRAQLEKIK